MPLGSIIGGFLGSNGAGQAGGAAGAAGNQAWQRGEQSAAEARAAASPWTAGGQHAADQLLKLYGLGHFVNAPGGMGGVAVDPSTAQQDQTDAFGAFKTSPGYNFRLQQGVNALDRSAAAKGALLSGAQGRALSDYGQNTGSAEFGNYVGELNTMSGTGASSANAANNAAVSAQNTGNTLGFNGAMGQASSYSNAANALASGISKGINNLGSIATFNPYGAFGNI